MKVTKDKIENSQAFLTVEMEPAEMEAAKAAAFRHLAQKASVPGFRKGKAPRPVLERYLKKESILEETLEHLVPQAYEQAIKEQEIEPFAHPDIEVTQTDPVVFKATVPLTPAVELGDYHAVQMAPDPVEVTVENTGAVLEELRHQHAVWEPVERPADYGDMVILNIDSEIEEKPFIKKLGVQYQLLRDAIAPAPGFAEQLTGGNKGDEKEFKLKFPDDYLRKDIAGKEAYFKVKIEEIKKEKLPELDDELAKQVSPDFKTLDALRDEVTKNLRQRGEERARMDFEERVVNAVVEPSQVSYPPVLVEMEIDRLLNERARQLQMSGVDMDAYLKSLNKTEAALRDELRPAAAKNVTASLVLGKVAENEKIEAGEAEINAEIDGMTRNVAEDRKGELRKLVDNPQTRESIKRSLIMRKTLERLVEIAKGPELAKTEAKEDKK